MKLGVCLFAILGFLSLRAAAAEKPNMVFILSDDQGWADVGWHGKEIKTPNLDQLAASGARLEQFLCATGVLTDTRRAHDRPLPDAPRAPGWSCSTVG